MFIDTQSIASIFGGVIRLILSCLVALSLLGSAPAVAAMEAPSAALSGGGTMADSVSGMPDGPMPHDKMPCCTSDCTMTGTAGLMEPGGVALGAHEPVKAPLGMAPVKQLDSLDLATVDPPPRRLPS